MAASVVLAVAPAAALADSVTVDDDQLDCPAAQFTSLTAAVAAAAQGDTIDICPGTYTVPGGAGSPGLRIEKNISLRGAGADRVFIQPDLTADSMAATGSPRDAAGNVITVRRRTLELFDVNISGLTVRSFRPGGGEAVEAGIAMVDVTNGSISGVRVTGLVPATGPGTGAYAASPLIGSGHGIVIANDLESTVDTIAVSDSLIEGYNGSGILVDGRQYDGAAASTVNGGTVRATLTGNRIVGAPGAAAGVTVDGGPCVRVSGSEIVGSATGVFLHGLGTSPACSTWASRLTAGNTIAGNAYGVRNQQIDGTPATSVVNARATWWGSVEGPSIGDPTAPGGAVDGYVDFGGALAAAPRALVVPVPAPDAKPTIAFDGLKDGALVAVGDEVELDAVPDDDFGVQRVEYAVDGKIVTTVTTPDRGARAPYAATWIPGEAADAAVHAITATVFDSAGQSATVRAQVQVGELPPPVQDSPAAGGGGGEEPVVTDTPVVTAGEPSTNPGGGAAAPPVSAPVGPVAALPTVRISGLGAQGATKRLRVTSSGAASVVVTLTATSGGRSITVGTASIRLRGRGSAPATIRLTAAGRKLLARSSGRLRVHAAVTVTVGTRSQTRRVAVTVLG
jgi:hypothetical protein